MRTALQTLLKSRDHRLERRIVLALLLGLALTLVIHFFSSTSIRHLLASDEKVMFIFELDNYLEDLDHQLISLESNLRSYIISEAAGLLGEIGANIAQARDKMDNVSTMADGLPDPPNGVHRLRELVELKIKFSEAVLDSFSRSGESAAIELINTREGLRLRDSIIRITSELRQLERLNITHTIGINRNEAQEVSQIDYLSTLLAAGIVLLAIFYFLKSIEYRKAIQLKLEEARLEAERSAQVKEQFAANMSHEIRTPLHAVLSFSEMLASTELNAEQKELTEGIQISGENLSAIVNDILDFSKMEAGMVTLEEIPFRLTEVWHKLERVFTPKAEAKGLQITFNDLSRSSDLLLGDPVKLNQILTNLISNAIKFTEEGGVQIWGYLRKEANNRRLLEIKVIDSGIGIAEDHLEPIFERFRQEEAATSRRYGGTGLGLAIVKHLVELQGGTVSCQSQIGRGSTFTVCIPYAKAVSPAAGMTKEPSGENAAVAPAPSYERILLAEDNPLNRRIMALFLKEWKYDFDLAKNGREALAMATQSNYDLIFLDIQMPELDGYQVARQIRQKLGNTVPIIAITANAQQGEKDKCLKIGINDILQKPFRKNELLSLLNRYARLPSGDASQSRKKANKMSSTGPIMDLAYLQSISNGKPERLLEMATIFLDQAPKEFLEIQIGIQKADLNRVAAMAHSMQSTVAYMGLAQWLGPSLQDLEKQARIQDPEGKITDIADRLQKELNRAMELVRHQLGENII